MTFKVITDDLLVSDGKINDITKEYRKKGYGKKILQFIEKWVLDSGFYRIRAEDLRNHEFWRKMGYNIDIDEGEKELDPFEYE